MLALKIISKENLCLYLFIEFIFALYTVFFTLSLRIFGAPQEVAPRADRPPRPPSLVTLLHRHTDL